MVRRSPCGERERFWFSAGVWDVGVSSAICSVQPLSRCRRCLLGAPETTFLHLLHLRFREPSSFCSSGGAATIWLSLRGCGWRQHGHMRGSTDGACSTHACTHAVQHRSPPQESCRGHTSTLQQREHSMSAVARREFSGSIYSTTSWVMHSAAGAMVAILLISL